MTDTDFILSKAAIAWANENCGLSRATLELLAVFFPELKRKSPALFFRYNEGWKARSFPEKSFVCDKGTKPGFWNLDAVLAGPCETIFITEGELDAAALVELGLPIDVVLSVPAGAKKLNDKDPDRGFGYVQDAIAAGLKRIKRSCVVC